MNFKKLDAKAKNIAQNYLRLEAELLDVLLEIYKSKAYIYLGYKSLYEYIHRALNISPATTYNIHGIIKKSCQVPELKEKIQEGELSISKAAKMTSVLTPKNKDHWFQLAKIKTHRQLEREVALSSPKQAVRERAQYVHPDMEIKEKTQVKSSAPRMALQMGTSEKLMLKLRRAQDLESSRLKKSLNLEETLEQILEFYLEKKDPLKVAQRQNARGKLPPDRVKEEAFNKPTDLGKNEKGEENSSREEKGRRRKPIPASTVHRVQLRDQGQCTFLHEDGSRCSSKRYLDIHHVKPVSQGGEDQLENLTLLCRGHHRMIHLKKGSDI